jgi:hypothetical protein
LGSTGKPACRAPLRPAFERRPQPKQLEEAAVSENANSLSDEERVLDKLVDRIAARIRRGETVDLDTYIREHPACAERLRQLQPARELLGELRGRGITRR